MTTLKLHHCLGHDRLTDGRPLTEEERQTYLRIHGRLPAVGAAFPDKRRVRIDVAIPSTDRALKPWLPWARKRLDPHWLDALHAAGGGVTKARTWFLYFGVVPPSRFRSVGLRAS